jgi:FtsP/CotA-like multicopper oxidase with cupredoxin domain
MLFAVAAALQVFSAPLPHVGSNDNRTPAGRLMGGAWHLDLDIVRGEWHPEGNDHAGASILAFAERGGAPSTPGPLLRVRAGTPVSVSVHNTTGDTLVIHGFAEKFGLAARDTTVLLPGETRYWSFTPRNVGSYFYWGARPGETQLDTKREDAPLDGAIVVDLASGPILADRVIVIDNYIDGLDSAGVPDPNRELLVMNGRPWPFTERMQYTVGDSIRWRVINASTAVHPMHLHGFYFRVDARGDWRRDTVYSDAQRRMAVTEMLAPGNTMNIVWSPDRPGGWLFHCHLSFHALMNPPLGNEWPGAEQYHQMAYFAPDTADAAHHVEDHMGGLLMVVRVVPKGPIPPRSPAARTVRLEVVASNDTDPSLRTYGYRLAANGPDATPGPAPLLLFQKNQPTDVVILNHTHDATSVHWHGMEIEGYSDGVVGVGGYAHMPIPPIMPGDSFVARIMAPRSGSFMYHTHISDISQEGKGLAGPIVVVDKLADYDATHQRIYLLHNFFDAKKGRLFVLLNASRKEAPPDTVHAGESYRLRFMNITLANPLLRQRYSSDGTTSLWTEIAKDGYDLPTWQRNTSADPRPVSIGETMDVLWTPAKGSSGWLEVRGGGGQLIVRQHIEVIGKRDGQQ